MKNTQAIQEIRQKPIKGNMEHGKLMPLSTNNKQHYYRLMSFQVTAIEIIFIQTT